MSARMSLLSKSLVYDHYKVINRVLKKIMWCHVNYIMDCLLLITSPLYAIISAVCLLLVSYCKGTYIHCYIVKINEARKRHTHTHYIVTRLLKNKIILDMNMNLS